MANIKDLKKRIKSTKNTFKITSAMKLVSAAKLSKIQGKIQGFKPYSMELTQTVKTVAALSQDYTHEFLKESKENNRSLLLVVSSDKGLCGSYNSQLYKKVKKFLATTTEEIEVVFIGKKVRDLLARDGVKGGKTFTYEKQEPTLAEAKAISGELADMFKAGEVGRVYIAYNSFQSAIEFHSNVDQILPLATEESEKEKLSEEFPFDFLYEPSAEEILEELIPEVLNTTVYTNLMDAIAAEHGSRMTSMENASKNCKEMIRKVTLKMNKLRQAAITTELIEVVSGAESLNS